MKILVIDDDVLLRRMLARILLGEGHEVLTAADGERGMTMFHRERPQIVITDIVMPEQEGLETILALRRDNAPVKIIAMSGTDAEMLDIARLIGADEIIAKPFRADEMLRCVREMAVAGQG